MRGICRAFQVRSAFCPQQKLVTSSRRPADHWHGSTAQWSTLNCSYSNWHLASLREPAANWPVLVSLGFSFLLKLALGKPEYQKNRRPIGRIWFLWTGLILLAPIWYRGGQDLRDFGI